MIVAGFSKSLTTFFRLSFVCSVIVPPSEYHTTKRRQSAPKISVHASSHTKNNNNKKKTGAHIKQQNPSVSRLTYGNIVESIARISDDETMLKYVTWKLEGAGGKRREKKTHRNILEKKTSFLHISDSFIKSIFFCVLKQSKLIFLLLFLIAVVPLDFFRSLLFLSSWITKTIKHFQLHAEPTFSLSFARMKNLGLFFRFSFEYFHCAHQFSHSFSLHLFRRFPIEKCRWMER